MRKFLVLFLTVNLFLSICPETIKKNMEKNIDHFKIEIIRYYFGRENIRIVVTHEQLMCETAVALNKKDYTLLKRILTVEESSTLKEFLLGFPLDKFKESYYNKGVKDGMQIGFTISINGAEKNIYVANYYIRELGDLVSVISKLLPEDHLNYNPKTVPAIIKK